MVIRVIEIEKSIELLETDDGYAALGILLFCGGQPFFLYSVLLAQSYRFSLAPL